MNEITGAIQYKVSKQKTESYRHINYSLILFAHPRSYRRQRKCCILYLLWACPIFCHSHWIAHKGKYNNQYSGLCCGPVLCRKVLIMACLN